MTGITIKKVNGVDKSIVINIKKCSPEILEYLRKTGLKICTSANNIKIEKVVAQSEKEISQGKTTRVTSGNLWDIV